MNFLSISELQDELLQMLIFFDDFCSKHNLRYSLDGGTLLGAIRHQGFIPWDDDADVSMPRPDFEHLLKLEPLLPEPYAFQKQIKYPFLKLINTRIRAQSDQLNGLMDEFLWIDVFPIDGMPSSESRMKQLIYKQWILLKLGAGLLVSNSYLTGVSGKIIKAGRIVLSPFISAEHLYNIIDKNARKIEFSSSELVGLSAWCAYTTPDIMFLSDFDNLIDVCFEGQKLKAIPSWDFNLSKLYGDYMQLPPLEDRQTHGVNSWRVD